MVRSLRADGEVTVKLKNEPHSTGSRKKYGPQRRPVFGVNGKGECSGSQPSLHLQFLAFLVARVKADLAAYSYSNWRDSPTGNAAPACESINA